MANSHYDSDFREQVSRDWLKQLETKAAAMQSRGESQVTGGKPGEQELSHWNCNGIDVVQLPADEHGVLRISVGGGNTPVPLNYLRFRGPHGACVDLLRKALAALEQGPQTN